jgi:glucosylceramidase
VSKYLTAYHDRGIDIWAVTPENEPLGNGGHWESMEFTPEEMTRYVVRNLGPTLAADHPGVKILHFDHNRDQVEAWTTSLFTEPDAPKYVAGTATHWYASSYLVFSDGLDRIHAARGDDHLIINTEAAIGTGTIDSGLYFGVWSYFWTVRGSSAHSSSANFPATSPIGHYLTDIVGGLNHWMNGWIEWNLALDRQGGPRHICDPSITRCGCMAPVMVDTDAGQLFYTPIYYVLSHFSKFIRPGARVLTTVAPAGLIATAAQNSNGTVAVVVVNSFNHPSEYASVVDRDYAIQIGQRSVSVHIPAHAIQTVLVTP